MVPRIFIALLGSLTSRKQDRVNLLLSWDQHGMAWRAALSPDRNDHPAGITPENRSLRSHGLIRIAERTHHAKPRQRAVNFPIHDQKTHEAGRSIDRFDRVYRLRFNTLGHDQATVRRALLSRRLAMFLGPLSHEGSLTNQSTRGHGVERRPSPVASESFKLCHLLGPQGYDCSRTPAMNLAEGIDHERRERRVPAMAKKSPSTNLATY
jgi:hypothetical protein